MTSPLSPDRGLAPLPFAVAATVIYLLSFGSQVLLSPPVTVRVNVVAFALAQTALIWAWLVIHTRRLRDAGRPAGLAVGIALVYAIEVVLLVIVVWLMLESGQSRGGGVGSDAPILQLFVILYLLTLLSGDPGLGVMQWWIFGFVALMLLPVVIAFGFSVWTASRPRAPATP